MPDIELWFIRKAQIDKQTWVKTAHNAWVKLNDFKKFYVDYFTYCDETNEKVYYVVMGDTEAEKHELSPHFLTHERALDCLDKHFQ